MPAGSSASWTSCGALALLLALGCGRHDTPLASYQAVLPDAGAGGAPAELVCPESYATVVEGLRSRYRPVTTGKPWVEAELDCEADGGHLIIIDDELENAWLAEFAATAITNDESTHQLAWMGLGDSVSEGDFSWVTGGALSTSYWSEGEPNTAYEDEDCVEMRASARWNDDRCDAPLIYVCECDGTPSAKQWCDSNTDTSCGDCTTACPLEQSCVKQQCL